MTAPLLPGRLGTPDMSLGTDPRADPRMVALFHQIGLADNAVESPVTASSTIDELLAFCDEAEPGYDMLFAMLTQ